MLILVEQAEKILAKMKTATITVREMVDAGKLEDAVEYATKNASGVEEYEEVMRKIMCLSMRELQSL